MKLKAPLLLLSIVFACSCTVDAGIRIHDDASGEVSITIRLHPVAVTYMSDLMTGLGAEDSSVFDRETIERAFADRPGVELRELEQIGSDTIRLDVAFDDILRLFETTWDGGPPLGDPPIRLVGTEAKRTLTVALSRSNFGYFSSLFVMPDSPLTVLLPYSESDFMPKDEYLEVLEYALEDYLEGLSVSKLLEGQSIRTKVEADRVVREVQGGVIVLGEALFDVPIIDMLTLEQDVMYSLTW